MTMAATGRVASPPAWAVPLRAVDSWDCEADGAGLSATARVRVDPGEVNLRGHFPGQPVYPGVFIVETLRQLAGLALPDAGGAPPVLREVRAVRFLAPLVGGDQLTLTARMTPADSDGWLVQAEGVRGDGVTASRLTAVLEAAGAADVSGEPEAGGLGDAPAQPSPTEARALDHAAIRAVLPQRHPLLLVDKVISLIPGRSIHAVTAVTATDPCYANIPDDAPPAAYTYPPSLLIEAFGQSAALLWLDQAGSLSAGQVLLFTAARGIRFHGTARPGDSLDLSLQLDTMIADTAFASGQIRVRGRCIADVQVLTAARRPQAALAPV